MNILCCTDHNYITPTCVTIYSACINNQDISIKFYIISNPDVTEEDKTKLKNITSKYHHTIEFISAPTITKRTECFTVNKEGQPKHITIASYYRLFLADLLPKEIEKIIYLDSDLIVRNSLEEMYSYNIEDYAVGAIPDMFEGYIEPYNRLRYPQSMGYFNAGVLLININFWRKNNLLEKFIEFATLHPERIVAHDQDILNYVLRNNKLRLPLKYNTQNGFLYKNVGISWEYEKEIEDAIKNPFILHYTGSKPCEKVCTHPYRDEYLKYYKNIIGKMPFKKTFYEKLKCYIKLILDKYRINKSKEAKSIYRNLPKLS